jgi:phage shock protein PspC (stress-responsive transcriptional regulator)
VLLRGIGGILSGCLAASVCRAGQAAGLASSNSGMMADMSFTNGSSNGKTLLRRLDGRMVAGVCAGLADYTGIDVNLIRLAFAVVTIFGGIGVLAYIAAWVIVPEEGEPASIAEKLMKKTNG